MRRRSMKLYYAPWDDPDPSDYMTDEDMKRMAEAAAAYMGWDAKQNDKLKLPPNCKVVSAVISRMNHEASY
jgi:hypothetical protein